MKLQVTSEARMQPRNEKKARLQVDEAGSHLNREEARKGSHGMSVSTEMAAERAERRDYGSESVQRSSEATQVYATVQ